MNRLLIFLCIFLTAVCSAGDGDSRTAFLPQKMITSDTFLGIRTRADVRTQRLYVTEVAPDSPAAQADIRPGDIIRRVNGHSVKSREEFFLQMRHFRAGEQLPLQLLRAGESITLGIILGSRPAPAVIGRVHSISARPVAMGNLVSLQIELAAALSRPGTTLADVRELLRSICRDTGGRAARSGHIRLTYRDKDGIIRIQHRPGRLEIISSCGNDTYSAALLTQPWHTLPLAFQRRFSSIASGSAEVVGSATGRAH